MPLATYRLRDGAYHYHEDDREFHQMAKAGKVEHGKTVDTGQEFSFKTFKCECGHIVGVASLTEIFQAEGDVPVLERIREN